MRVVCFLVSVSLVACSASVGSTPPPSWDETPSHLYVQLNLGGGLAAGARDTGVDGVAAMLVEVIEGLPEAPAAVFLNEACESHAASVAIGLGEGWRWFFLPSWPGESHCFPAAGAPAGRFGNAVLVDDEHAVPIPIPSCNEPDADQRRCLPNWPPPAEQRNAICAALGEGVRCAVHLDLATWQWHREQLRATARMAAELALDHGQVVVGGDFNIGRGDVERAFADVAAVVGVEADVAGTGGGLRTYPARRPDRALDHVVAVTAGHQGRWVDARAVDLGDCVATQRADGRCTDHLAVLAAWESP